MLSAALPYASERPSQKFNTGVVQWDGAAPSTAYDVERRRQAEKTASKPNRRVSGEDAHRMLTEAQARVDERREALGNVPWPEALERSRARLASPYGLPTIVTRESANLERWEMFMCVCLVETALMAPFEVAFLEPELWNFLFTLNRLIELAFLIDMIMCFCTAYDVPGQLAETRRSRIAINYIRHWFFIDLITVIPYDWISLYLDLGANIKLVRLLRALRLLKLLRVLSSSKLYKRYVLSISVPYAKLQLAQFGVLIVLMGHWLGCIWGFALRLNNESENSWLSSLIGGKSHGTWGPGGTYMLCVYFAVKTLTSIGYGDVVPISYEEHVVAIFLMLVGASTWAFIIGSACGLFASLDEAGIAARQTFDNVNSLIEEQQLPDELAIRLRQFFAQSMRMSRVQGYGVLLQRMTKALRGEVAWEQHGPALLKIWYFQFEFMRVDPKAHRSFIEELALRLKLQLYAPKEFMRSQRDIIILKRGVASVGGRVHHAVAVWGTDALVSLDIRVPEVAFSLTFCEVYTLSPLGISEAEMVLAGAEAWAKDDSAYTGNVTALRRAQLWMTLRCEVKAQKRKRAAGAGSQRNGERMWSQILASGDAKAEEVKVKLSKRERHLEQNEVERQCSRFRGQMSSFWDEMKACHRVLRHISQQVEQFEEAQLLLETCLEVPGRELDRLVALRDASKKPERTRAR
mmetsp:Transcript_50667/g.133519  ORF Transcript_50667/g.133519 Transcript_50667/m.133519 type:complete len:690 (-) Transcript_50667:31-2100(-)